MKSVDVRTAELVVAVHAQHEHLFRLLRALADGLMGQQPSRVLRDHFTETRDLLAVHFETEETLMEFALYPGLRDHRHLHTQMMGEIATIDEGLAAGAVYCPLDQHRLRAVVQGHTAQADSELDAYLAGTLGLAPNALGFRSEPAGVCVASRTLGDVLV